MADGCVSLSVYNLKRRIAELPPVPLDTFNTKVAPGGKAPSAQDFNVHHERRCVYCDNTFKDLKLYQRHLKSWQHVKKVEEAESDQDPTLLDANASLESILLAENQSDSEGESVATIVEEFKTSECLFCTQDHGTLEHNLQHMQQDHGLFIPDRDHLVDLEAFIGYLFTIISEFNECLYCGHIKSTSHGIRQHMLNRGHCKLKSREDPEYEDFYDDSSLDLEASHDKEARSTEIAKLQSDTDHEVRLESGRIIGDRAQTASSRPNFRSHTKPAESQLATTSKVEGPKPPAHRQVPPGRQLITRADGGLGMLGVSDLQKRALRAVEKKMLQTEIRARNQYRAGVDRAANKTTQKHFKVTPIEPHNLNLWS